MKQTIWFRIGIVAAVLFVLSAASIMIILVQVYGCAGASFETANQTLPASGSLCSTQGLHTVQVINRIFLGFAVVSFFAMPIGFIINDRKQKTSIDNR